MSKPIVKFDDATAAGAIAGTAAMACAPPVAVAKVREPKGLHICYKVMIVLTFLLVFTTAVVGMLAFKNIIQVPGVTPNVRGGTPAGNAEPVDAPAESEPAKLTLGRTGVVEPNANERATGPVAAWTAGLRPLASRPACVDMREFPSEVQTRLLNEVRAATKRGDPVAIADAKTCHGALMAKKPEDSSRKDFGVPDAATANGRRSLESSAFPTVVHDVVSLSRPSLSLFNPNLAAAVANPTDPITYIYAKNLAALSRFFIWVRLNIDWEAYYDGQCRHEYMDTHTGKQKIKFDFRPNGGRCQGSNAAYFYPCLFHPMVSPVQLQACVGPDCASTMQAKSEEMYRSSVSVVRFDQPSGTKEAIIRTNVGLGQSSSDKRKVQVAAALFSTNQQASHCPAAPWTHREMMGGGSLTDSADFGDYWRVYANNQNVGFAGREYVENYPHSFVMDTEVNLVTSLQSEIAAAIREEQPEANSIGVEVSILDPRSFSVYTTLVLDREATFSATKYIQTRTQYQIVHHGNTIQVGIFHRSWAWQTSSSVFWFVADALSDGASDMAQQVSAQVSATLAERFAESLPAGPNGVGVVAASSTTLVLGEAGLVFALVAL